MAKIKKLSWADIPNVKKLISFVCNDDIMSYRRLLFISVPVTHIQNFLYNVHCRKFPETYVVLDNSNNLKGVISVKAQIGNPYKWQLKRLFLDKSSHEEGKQLIEYIIAKFGARGVDTFYVSVDDNKLEIIDLFVKGCGFRYCSTEALWSVSNINFIQDNISFRNFKHFKNNDAQKVCELFNENLITHYKYSLTKEKEEFFESVLNSVNHDLKFKYVYCDEKTKEIKSFIEIETTDNYNYFIDILIPVQYFELYSLILSFGIKTIIKRNKNFKLYIRNRKYLQSGELIENFFKDNHFELLENRAILVRDFFKTVKENNNAFNEPIVFSSFEI